ncbi:arsenic resistance N-acetyltransferase ArsN2 [Accumulibacter sp.]|uniref:arsenic resistance N-acetyltransferase ArsN2 n=1 Tax=Accumulibacter sp. TaxID=2053492 RepID=UPI001AC29994|nr:arsenic resistance N-acetyltransferase ArsN2 [Accumulibacter sp.]MBN8514807.1 GNAT family N-acetyltransferase [Accumulibacter sp.]MBO3701692.1 GNAT family N-acetyltransferase [Accumulibacter sp.]HRI93355.1 arsenic resistance N-acetyltransferase ArsN2 [Accumulibacter sp.]
MAASSHTLCAPGLDELPALLALLADCALPVADIEAAHLPGFLICRDEGRLIATAGLQPCGETVLLRSLAVAAHCRQRGLAAQLLAALEQRALADGHRQIFLLTTSAQDFFSARGFRLLPRSAVPPGITATAQFRCLCPVSAACMVKILDGALARESAA